MTIVLSTRDMDEAAPLADRVAILDSGQLLTQDTPTVLVRGLTTGGTPKVIVELTGQHGASDLLKRWGAPPGVQRCDQRAAAGAGHTLRLVNTATTAALLAPVATTMAALGRLRGIEIAETDLDDVVIELTGRGLR